MQALGRIFALLTLLLGLGAVFAMPQAAIAQAEATARAARPGNWMISGLGKGVRSPLVAGPARFLDVTGTVVDGDPVLNLGCIGILGTRWCEVEKLRGDKARGYIRDKYLSEAPGRPTVPDDSLAGGPDFWTVTGLRPGDRLNVRRDPNASSIVLATLGEGERVRNLGCRMVGSARWCRIRSTEGVDVTGWVNGRFLSEAAPRPPAGGSGPDRFEVFGLRAGDTLNVRSTPSTSGRVLIGLINGDTVRNLGCQQSGGSRWCRIRYTAPGVDVTGWANARYLREPGDAPRPPAGTSEFLTVTGLTSNQRLNIRQAPSSSSPAIGTLGAGDRVRNLGCAATPGWCLIRTTRGADITGYVSNRYLSN